MNPLEEYPAARKVAYIVQWVANLATGILSIVFLNDDAEGVPDWFTVTVLVLAFVWAFTGLTAQQNVPSYRDVVEGDAPIPPPDRGQFHLNTAVLVLVAIAAIVVIIAFVNVNVR